MNNNAKQKVFCLMGPTAAGKTGLAIKLAQILPIEIISVDSAMIYRGMDIGTGKPTKEELVKAPHHLIDILDPKESYSAADFCDAAVRLVKQSHNLNKIPLFVGGTMMYFNALQNGLSELPEKNIEIREKIEQKSKVIGWGKLHQELAILDPVTAKNINPNDPQRISRALEVIEITDQPMSELFKRKNKYLDEYEVINFCVNPADRKLLHKNIETRFIQMLDDNFIAEVESLYNRGDLNLNMPSIRSVGYRQVWQYLAGKDDKHNMVEKAVIATRQLAKRQLTWLRNWQSSIEFFEYNTIGELNLILERILSILRL